MQQNLTTPCQNWHKSVRGSGYGQMTHNGKQGYAHRFAWMIANKQDIPKGGVIMHLCDNRLCVNPEHLQLGTQRDNIHDMMSKGRKPKSGYKVGHKHSEETKQKISEARSRCKRTT